MTTTLGGTAVAATGGTAFNGTLARFTDSTTANVAADFSATVNCGDDTNCAGIISDVSGAVTVTATHRYAAMGPDALSVTLTDADGTATATSSRTATMRTAYAGAGMAISGSAAGGGTITLGAASQRVVAGGYNERIKATATNPPPW